MSRTCGDCTMCCKLLGVSELNKQPGVWCKHCAIGSGCKIYENRPQSCREFACFWLQHEELSDDLRPDKTKMVLWEPEGAKNLMLHVDQGRLEGYRKGGMLKVLAALVDGGYTIGVRIGNETKVLGKGLQDGVIIEHRS